MSAINVGIEHMKRKRIYLMFLKRLRISLTMHTNAIAEPITRVKLGFVIVVKNKNTEKTIPFFMSNFCSSLNKLTNEKNAPTAKGRVAIYVALCQGLPEYVP
jgi:hypothetical protein